MTWARRSQEALDISQNAHQSPGLAHHENSFAFFDALLLQLLLALHLFLSGHGQWRIAMNYEGLKLVQASFFLRISSCRLRASSFRFLSASFLWPFQRRDECLHSPQEACSTALQLRPSLFLGLLPLELHLQPLRFNGFFNPFSMGLREALSLLQYHDQILVCHSILNALKLFLAAFSWPLPGGGARTPDGWLMHRGGITQQTLQNAMHGHGRGWSAVGCFYVSAEYSAILSNLELNCLGTVSPACAFPLRADQGMAFQAFRTTLGMPCNRGCETALT